MERITAKQTDALARILCRELGLPEETYVLNKTTGRYEAQIGCIHICSQNGTNNVYQISNDAGGCKGLAYGLTMREAYNWLAAALEGVRLARANGIHRGI